jgi:hypothetical protein
MTIPIRGYISTVLKGRNDYPPKVRPFIEKYGNKIIKNIFIVRAPIMPVINKILNVISFGEFQSKLDAEPYDDLFHLKMDLYFTDGTKLSVEKNEAINMYEKDMVREGSQEYPVNVPRPITLNELLEKGQASMGSNWFPYDAVSNNCQDFISAILVSNGLASPKSLAFVKQDVSRIFEENSFLKKVVSTISTIGTKANEILTGSGIKQKLINNNNNMDIVNKISMLTDEINKHHKMNGFDNQIAEAFRTMGGVIKKNLQEDTSKNEILKKIRSMSGRGMNGDITRDADITRDGDIMNDIKQHEEIYGSGFFEDSIDYVTSKKGLRSDIVNYGLPALSSAALGGLAGLATGGNPVAAVAVSALGSKLGKMGAKKILGEGIKKKRKISKRKSKKTTTSKETAVEQLIKNRKMQAKEAREEALGKMAMSYNKQFGEPPVPIQYASAIGSGTQGMKKRFAKGSQEAKDYMASIRKLKK